MSEEEIEKYDNNFWKYNKYELRPLPKKAANPAYREPPRNVEIAEAEKKLTAEEKATLRQMCEEDIYLFAIRYCGHYLKKPSGKLHKFLYKYFSDSFSASKTTQGLRTAIAAPRGNAKSSIVSTILPLWCICYAKKKVVLLISDTSDQAQDFLSDVKAELEVNELIKQDFPNTSGKGSTWRQDKIRTKNGVTILALGTGNKVRGRRYQEGRPDLVICHKKGTKIFDECKWLSVEDHPTAVEVKTNGLEVGLYCVPSTEIVTREHRYWCKDAEGNSAFWCKAKDLSLSYFIGCPLESVDIDICLFISKDLFIEDDFLWRRVTSVSERDCYDVFVPIQTKSGTYITAFGLSHNCDDLEGPDSVRSYADRHFTRFQWFNKDLLFVGADEPVDIVVLGTILGPDSLLNNLLDPKEYPLFTSFRFSAVNKFSTSPLWDTWRNILLDRFNPDREKDAYQFYKNNEKEMLEGVEILWPEGDPYYNLMLEKISNPSGFLSEKQSNPVDPTKILVSKEDLKFQNFNTPAIRQMLKNCYFYGCLDPSLGKKADKGDYSCICTIAREPVSGYIYVVNFGLKRRDVDTQIDDIIKNHDKYHYSLFGVEADAFQYVVAENLRKKSMELGVYVPVKDVYRANSGDKKLRFEGIVPLILDGTIIFNEYAYQNDPEYNHAINQITLFTGVGDKEDDAVDALEGAVSLVSKSKFKLLVRSTR